MPVDLAHGLIARWNDPDPKHVDLLRQAGIEAVVPASPAPRFSEVCGAAGIQTLPADQIGWLPLKNLSAAQSAKPVALLEGSWPGIARAANVPGRGDETASASREPWIEINGHWVAYLRALFPDRPAILAYEAPSEERMTPFDSLELALVEARVCGGNYILDVPTGYREALLRGDEKALSAWRQLGRTARWLRDQSSLMGLPVFPQVTQLVEPGGSTPEIAKLLFRRNASPRLEAAARVPTPTPGRLALVAVELEKPSEETRNRILAHAGAGTSVVVNGKWWTSSRLKLLRKEEDRDVFTSGKGKVVVYREAISDPSEFALDVIDIVTHKRRAARLWNAPTVVALAAGKGILTCVNYGSPIDSDVQARIHGTYSKATLLRPEGGSVPLKPARRSGASEVQIAELRRLGIVVFG
jgi:hypothetical protein